MENVHGISVAGGTFPAQIWRLFTSSAIGGLEPVSFPEPHDWPEWKSSCAGRKTARTVRGRRRRLLRAAGVDPGGGSGRVDDSAPEPAPEPDETRPRRTPLARPRLAPPHPPPTPPPTSPTPKPSRPIARWAAPRSSRPWRPRSSSPAAPSAPGSSERRLSRHAGRADDGGPWRGLPRASRRRVRLAISARWRLCAGARPRCPLCSPPRSLIQLLPLAAPLLLSTDAWTYWEYGRIAVVHGGNPYVDTPDEFPGDPAYEYGGAAWSGTSLGLRACVHAAIRGSGARLRLVRRSGRLDLQGPRGGRWSRAWCSRRLARERPYAAAARRLEPAPGDPLRRRGPQRLAPDRAHAGRNRSRRCRAQGPRRCRLGGRDPDQVDSARLLCSPGNRSPARGRRRVGHAGFAAAAIVVLAIATWRYGLDWVRAGAR